MLDVGCASGKTACYPSKRYGCSVVGVDLLPEMIELSRNPQIVGFFLAVVGFAIMWPSWYALGWVILLDRSFT